MVRPASYGDIERYYYEQDMPQHMRTYADFWEPLYQLYLAEWRKRGFQRSP